MRLLLISPANIYATQRLLQEAKSLDIAMTAMDIAELVRQDYDVDPAAYDALYIRQAYLDFEHPAPPEHLQRLVDLAKRFYSAGKAVIDQLIADGDIGSGKYEMLQQLQRQGITVPQTRWLNEVIDQRLSFPIIAKWNYGFGAKHTYLLKTIDDLEKVKRKYPAREIITQQFIPADFEYKVITVGYKSLPVIIKLKTNHNKFLPDLTQYQVLAANDPSPEVITVIKIAEQAARVLQRELAKVDILQAGDQFYVLEVNRWPGLQHFEKTTKYNVAGDFLQYIAAKASLNTK